MDQEDRKKLRARIAALAARTTGNGCTEAEALAAAEKLSELLSRHGMEDAAGLEFDEYRIEIGRRTVVDAAWNHVATFCHCEFWYARDWTRRRWTAVYFGRWNDVLIAEYLHALLARHIKSATREFQQAKEYTRRRSPRTKREATKAFQEAMVGSLIAQLWTIQWRRTPHVTGQDHRALVLAPLAAVQAELARRGWVFDTNLKPVKGASKGFDAAKNHGAIAGSRIDINAGLNANSGDDVPARIGYGGAHG